MMDCPVTDLVASLPVLSHLVPPASQGFRRAWARLLGMTFLHQTVFKWCIFYILRKFLDVCKNNRFVLKLVNCIKRN